MKLQCTFVMLVLCAPAAWSQSSAVPPSKTEARDSAIIERAFNAPTDLITIHGVEQAIKGNIRGASKTLDLAENAGYVSTATQGIYRVVEGYQSGGWQGAGTAAGMEVLSYRWDQTLDKAGAYALRRFGVGSIATGPYLAGGQLAWDAGTAVGDVIRDNTRIGRTINDTTTDLAFRASPDVFKEWVSGVPQVDTNSAAWGAKLDADAQAKYRQNVFNKVQAQNAEQERQRQAYAAQQSGQGAEAPAPDSAAVMLNILNDSLAQANRNKAPLVSTPTSAAAAKSCQLDPKTGCHPGHNEQSHPGGCKAC